MTILHDQWEISTVLT